MKGKMVFFRASAEMVAALDQAAARLRRDSLSQCVREDAVIPMLQELGLWPSRESEQAGTLVDSKVEYDAEADNGD